MSEASSSSQASQVKIFMRDNASQIVIAFALRFFLTITHFHSTALSFLSFALCRRLILYPQRKND